ncbi:M15 family metallopeptidase [Phaeobacter inhibens]|uniref:M15 family metallopeptidase n=1 Tax=Phaeobacter inhibens TaxID=221822 RepID=UPI00295EF192|nr:M15 family metallopeptidase [Phaeobacter inhibens]
MTQTPLSAADIAAFGGPVPLLRSQFCATGHVDIPLDKAHPLSGEALVDIRDYGIAGESYYHRDDGQNVPYCKQLPGSTPVLRLRKTLAEKLRAVNRRLAPLGLELFVWDAYRPIAVQAALWNHFGASLRAQFPQASPSMLDAMIRSYVADPKLADDSKALTCPNHLTGGSVDLTLRTVASKTHLDMGADFDQMDDIANTEHFEAELGKGRISGDDRRLLNRRLLVHVMAAEGFTNHPMEFWHFDWGNQMHQYVKDLMGGDTRGAAIYGPCHA